MALSTLYPPVVGTYGKTFLLDSGNIDKDTCRVYFSLSSYNTPSEIMNAQVTVVNQNTNRTALNPTKYPCEIMLTSIYTDATVTSDAKYYIQISKGDMKDNAFQINTYYKVQIRLTSIDASVPEYGDTQSIDSWLAMNLNNFSEWSTVCLIRGISTPVLNIAGLDPSAGSTVWTTADTRIAGSLGFVNPEEKDILKSYRLKLYNAATNELITDSNEQYANTYNNVNQINYTLKCEFIDGTDYRLDVTYTTSLLYTNTISYDFSVQQDLLDPIEATIETVLDEENARIGIILKSISEDSAFLGRLTIRRTSSESNYTIWEDVYSTAIVDSKALNLVWYDYSIESGIWYKYSAQRRNSVGARGVSITTDEPVCLNYDYCFLVGDDKQLKLKYNTQVSSLKRNIAESKTDTIGSKYPFIRRNGYMDYKSFGITGLITRFMDEEEIFVSEEELLNNQVELYENYNSSKQINKYNDTLYEKKFRDKVSDFLHENVVRLFKSPAEGNMIVKLTDISFTPVAGLNEYLYSFSATAYEIADCTIDNLNDYNIQSSLEYYIDENAKGREYEDSITEISKFMARVAQPFSLEKNKTSIMSTTGETEEPTWNVKFSQKRDDDISLITYISDYIGQEDNIFKANTEILSTLQQKYKRYQRDGYVINIDFLDSLKIEMLSEPYLIEETVSGPIVANTNSNLNNTISGWLVYINGNPIIIQGGGVYELKGSGIEITSLRVPADTQMNLEYHLQLSQTEDVSQLVKAISYYSKIGQRWGHFDYKFSLKNYLISKYFTNYSTYNQGLVSIDNIRVEAEPGTICYIKETNEGEYQKHIIGDTCELTLIDKVMTIDDVRVVGIHLDKATNEEAEREDYLEGKYIDTGIFIDSLDEIEQPVINGVYTLNNKITNESQVNNFEKMIQSEIENSNKYIWYNNNWNVITDEGDIFMSVEAMIDYYCTIMKGTFAV